MQRRFIGGRRSGGGSNGSGTRSKRSRAAPVPPVGKRARAEGRGYPWEGGRSGARPEDDDGDSSSSDVEDDVSRPGDGARGLAAPVDVVAEEERRSIRELERKLGLRGGKQRSSGIKRLNREFAEEGLDEDFGSFLDSLDGGAGDSSGSEDGEGGGEEEDEEAGGVDSGPRKRGGFFGAGKGLSEDAEGVGSDDEEEEDDGALLRDEFGRGEGDEGSSDDNGDDHHSWEGGSSDDEDWSPTAGVGSDDEEEGGDVSAAAFAAAARAGIAAGEYDDDDDSDEEEGDDDDELEEGEGTRIRLFVTRDYKVDVARLCADLNVKEVPKHLIKVVKDTNRSLAGKLHRARVLQALRNNRSLLPPPPPGVPHIAPRSTRRISWGDKASTGKGRASLHLGPTGPFLDKLRAEQGLAPNREDAAVEAAEAKLDQRREAQAVERAIGLAAAKSAAETLSSTSASADEKEISALFLDFYAKEAVFRVAKRAFAKSRRGLAASERALEDCASAGMQPSIELIERHLSDEVDVTEKRVSMEEALQSLEAASDLYDAKDAAYEKATKLAQKTKKKQGERAASSALPHADAASPPIAAAGGQYVPPHKRKLMAATTAADVPSAAAFPSSSSSSSSAAAAGGSASGASLAAAAAVRLAEFSIVGARTGTTLSVDVAGALRRRLQGVLNRLTEASIEPLSAEVSALYRSYPAAEVTNALLILILDGCAHETQVLPAVTMSFAALISALHITVGPAVGAAALERLTLAFAHSAALPLVANPTQAALDATAPYARGWWLATAAAGGDAGSSVPAPAKLRANILLVLTYLFIFNTASSPLLSSILTALVARFAEPDVEIFLEALRHGGFALRADDPAALRDLLKAAHARVKAAALGTGSGEAAAASAAAPRPTSAPTSLLARATMLAREEAAAAATSGAAVVTGASSEQPVSARMRFLGELVLDIKNNRIRGEQAQIMERGMQLRKWLNRLASRTAGLEGTDRRLRLGWGDIMDIPTRGRWWVVGASWAGRAAAGEASLAAQPTRLRGKESNSGEEGGEGGVDGGISASSEVGIFGADTPKSAVGGGGSLTSASFVDPAAVVACGGQLSARDASLLELARAMRMNTPTRRAVFVALMGADDVEGAVDRLLRLNLRGPSEREIVRVAIDCSAQEVAYNSFYALVGSRLCTLHPRFKFTFQLALWDAFKTFAGSEEEGGVEGGLSASAAASSGGGAATSRRLFNLAKLVSALLLKGAATLALLKPLSFTGGSRASVLFLKALFSTLLTDAPSTRDIALLFSRLGAGADRVPLRDGIAVFLHQYMSSKSLSVAATAAGGPVVAAAVVEKLRVAKRALDAVGPELLGGED